MLDGAAVFSFAHVTADVGAYNGKAHSLAVSMGPPLRSHRLTCGGRLDWKGLFPGSLRWLGICFLRLCR